MGRPAGLPGPPPAGGPRRVAGRRPAGHHGRHARPEAHPLPHRAVGDRPGGRAARPQADAGHRGVRRPRSSPTATCSSPRPAPTPTRRSPPTTPRPRSGGSRPRARPTWWARRAGGIGPPVVARDAGTVVVDGDDAARRRHRRGRRGPPHGPQGPEGQRDPARRAPGAVLGPRSRPGRGTAARGHRARRRRRSPGATSPRHRPGPSARSRSAPDGAAVVAEWEVPERHGGSRTTLVVVDVASGERRTLLDDPAADFGAPTISPDGTRVACVRETRSTATAPIDRTVLVVPLAGGDPQEVAPRLGPLARGALLGGRRAPRHRRRRGPSSRVPRDARLGQPRAAHRRRRLLQRPRRRPGRQRALRPAERDRRPARTGAARPGRARPATGAAARPGRAARAAGHPHRGHRDRRRRHPAARLARAAPTATGGRRCCSGSTAARSAAGTPGSGGGTRG